MRKETFGWRRSPEVKDPGKPPEVGGGQQGASGGLSPAGVWGQWGGAGGEGQENPRGGCALESCIGVDLGIAFSRGLRSRKGVCVCLSVQGFILRP